MSGIAGSRLRLFVMVSLLFMIVASNAWLVLDNSPELVEDSANASITPSIPQCELEIPGTRSFEPIIFSTGGNDHWLNSTGTEFGEDQAGSRVVISNFATGENLSVEVISWSNQSIAVRLPIDLTPGSWDVRVFDDTWMQFYQEHFFVMSRALIVGDWVTFGETHPGVFEKVAAEPISGIQNIDVRIPRDTTFVRYEIFEVVPFDAEGEGEPHLEENFEPLVSNTIFPAPNTTLITISLDTSGYIDGTYRFDIQTGSDPAHEVTDTYEAITFETKQDASVDPILLVATATVATGLAVGAGIVATTAASAGVGGAAAGSAALTTSSSMGVLSRLGDFFAKVLGETVQEKTEEVIVDREKDVGAVQAISNGFKMGIRWRPFFISVIVFSLSFTIAGNGGALAWKGLGLNLLQIFLTNLLLVLMLLTFINVINFWVADRMNVRKKWRVGLTGLFSMVLTSLFGVVFGNPGTTEVVGESGHDTRTMDAIKVRLTLVSLLALMIPLTVFGALAMSGSAYLRTDIAMPGIFFCLMFGFYAVIPAPGFSGLDVWHWNKPISLVAFITPFAVMLLDSLGWMPSIGIVILGATSIVAMVLVLHSLNDYRDGQKAQAPPSGSPPQAPYPQTETPITPPPQTQAPPESTVPATMPPPPTQTQTPPLPLPPPPPPNPENTLPKDDRNDQ